jgi:heme-degrading monooxygenase HmoA
MIARIWAARATRANAQVYSQHFEEEVIARVRTIRGYVGGSLLMMDRGENVEILVITRWQSMDAIRSFAGDDVEVAVVADAAQRVLLSWDERVRHFAIALDDVAEPASSSGQPARRDVGVR